MMSPASVPLELEGGEGRDVVEMEVEVGQGDGLEVGVVQHAAVHSGDERGGSRRRRGRVRALVDVQEPSHHSELLSAPVVAVCLGLQCVRSCACVCWCVRVCGQLTSSIKNESVSGRYVDEGEEAGRLRQKLAHGLEKAGKLLLLVVGPHLGGEVDEQQNRVDLLRQRRGRRRVVLAVVVGSEELTKSRPTLVPLALRVGRAAEIRIRPHPVLRKLRPPRE